MIKKLEQLIETIVKSVVTEAHGISDFRRNKKTFVTLYHIGPHPARPKPFRHTNRSLSPAGKRSGWNRPYLDEPVVEGVFLSDNWKPVYVNHGVHGNVYAYKIPYKAIEAAGGIHEYDFAREIVFSKEIWDKYNLSSALVGKVYNKSEAEEEILRKKGKFAFMVGHSTEFPTSGSEYDKEKPKDAMKPISLPTFIKLLRTPVSKQIEIAKLLSPTSVKRIRFSIEEYKMKAENAKKECQEKLKRTYSSFANKTSFLNWSGVCKRRLEEIKNEVVLVNQLEHSLKQAEK